MFDCTVLKKNSIKSDLSVCKEDICQEISFEIDLFLVKVTNRHIFLNENCQILNSLTVANWQKKHFRLV